MIALAGSAAALTLAEWRSRGRTATAPAFGAGEVANRPSRAQERPADARRRARGPPGCRGPLGGGGRDCHRDSPDGQPRPGTVDHRPPLHPPPHRGRARARARRWPGGPGPDRRPARRPSPRHPPPRRPHRGQWRPGLRGRACARPPSRTSRSPCAACPPAEGRWWWRSSWCPWPSGCGGERSSSPSGSASRPDRPTEQPTVITTLRRARPSTTQVMAAAASPHGKVRSTAGVSVPASRSRRTPESSALQEATLPFE